MQILKQFLELQLAEYDHLHGRIKMAKVVKKIHSDDKLNDFMEEFSIRGEVIPPRIVNAALHEKLFFILGNSQRLKAGLCYSYLLHLKYLEEYNQTLTIDKEAELLQGIQFEINSMKM